MIKINNYTSEEVFNLCKNAPFPGSSKYESSHPIWECRVGINNMSPKEAWQDDSRLQRAVDNLFRIYNECKYGKHIGKYPDFVKKIEKYFEKESTIPIVVLERFTIAKIAPKVTALSKSTMKKILTETGINLSDYPGVYCPMAGFGGIISAIKELGAEVEAYDYNSKFCEYFGWTQRDALAQKIVTDKIIICCPPFGSNYENWNEKSELEQGTDNGYYTFKEWCEKLMEHIEAPNYIFIGPSEKNSEKPGQRCGLFAKKVGVMWYKEYTKL